MTQRVVIYTRVSRDDSGEGKSNERQEAEARRLCEYKRWDVVEIVSDVSISAAGKAKRPGWDRVLDMVRNGEVDHVVAYAMDRMTRNMLDLERLIILCEESGVGIATVDGDINLTSEMGRMIARILAAVARAEIEVKARRQKLANATRAAEGETHSGGARPFGYDSDYKTPLRAEAEAIRQGAEAALAGIPLAAIAKDWARAGLVSSRAAKTWEKRVATALEDGTYTGWSARGVKGVLTNPRYAGIRIYNGERVGAGDWEPILDLETHLRLVDMLTSPERRKGAKAGKTGRTPQSLLTGIMRCSVCTATVRASSIRGQLTYSCRNGCCQVDRAEADEWVLAGMVVELASEEWVSILAKGSDDVLAEAKRVVEEQRENLKMYARLLAQKVMDEMQFAEASAMARQVSKEAEQALVRTGQGSVLVGLDVGMSHVEEQLRGLPLARQRAIVKQLATVTVKPQNRNRRALFPVTERVTVEI